MAESGVTPSHDVGVVITDSDGVIVGQNARAVELIGDRVGEVCWQALRQSDDGATFPCGARCVRALMAQGADGGRVAEVSLGGRRYGLTCVPLDGQVLTTLTETTPAAPAPWERLTPREVDILRLLADGQTTPQVARALSVAESTVKTHVEHMRAKLAVTTRAGLVARGFRLGYLR